MESLTTIFIGLIAGASIAGVISWIFIKKFMSQNNSQDSQSMLLLQNQLENLSKTIDSKLGDSQKEMREAVQNQFSESRKLIQSTDEQMSKHLMEITRNLAESKEASNKVFTVADQLKNLEKVLLHQKQRGNLGEASLELSLSNILPADAYSIQYLFKNGDQVDAVIKTKEGLIPVDAKFSLDNYNRIINETDDDKKKQLEKDFRNDLKKRIDETAKYIRIKEGTLPFVFMYIPAEGIYYDLLINEVGAMKVNTRSLIDYAYTEKNVIIVSPTTFSAYLQSVLYGFKAFKIEESAKEVARWVEKLTRHLRAYDEHFKKVGKSLSTTTNHYNAAQKDFGMIDKDVFKITEGKAELAFEPIALDKPTTDED